MARYGQDFNAGRGYDHGFGGGYDRGFRGYGRDYRRNTYPEGEALQRGRYGRDAYGSHGEGWGMYSGLGADYDATYNGRFQGSEGGGRFGGQYGFNAPEQRGGGAAGGMVFGRYGGMDGAEFRPGYQSPRREDVGRDVPRGGQPGWRPGSGSTRGRGYGGR
jgi:hypothetical protein